MNHIRCWGTIIIGTLSMFSAEVGARDSQELAKCTAVESNADARDFRYRRFREAKVSIMVGVAHSRYLSGEYETSSKPACFYELIEIPDGRSLAVSRWKGARGSYTTHLSFQVIDQNGEKKALIQLNSSGPASEVAKEAGLISKNGRIFHLDISSGDSIFVNDIFDTEPPYWFVREKALEILDERFETILLIEGRTNPKITTYAGAIE